MTRRRGDPSESPTSGHVTHPLAEDELASTFYRSTTSPDKELGERAQKRRLPAEKYTHDEEGFEEPIYRRIPADQLPSFEEPNFDDQPIGRNGLIPDTDDEDMTTGSASMAADAQLRAEAARQTRRSPIRATQEGTSVGPSTGSNRGALPPKSGPAAKKLTLVPAPKRDDPGDTGAGGPLSYLRDHHAISAPTAHLTPQEKKDIEIDEHVMKYLAHLRMLTYHFCGKHFDGQLNFNTNDLQDFLEILRGGTRETVSYAGSIAEGGPQGLKGWVEIIRDPGLRRALVYGMIHRALKEHVFGALLFGAPANLIMYLEDLEMEQKDEDGFVRAASRANVIADHEMREHVKIDEYEDRARAIAEMALKLQELIQPIYALKFPNMTGVATKALKQGICDIVTAAADLSLFMRRNGDSVLYHFFPVFKGEDIDPVKMTILNVDSMQEQYHTLKNRSRAFPLVRVVCAFHLVAYRKNGGVMAERILEKEEKEPDTSVPPEYRTRPRNVYKGRVITAKDGFRSKFLAKAIVAGRFGDHSGMAEPDNDDGSVELLDIFRQGDSSVGATNKCAVM